MFAAPLGGLWGGGEDCIRFRGQPAAVAAHQVGHHGHQLRVRTLHGGGRGPDGVSQKGVTIDDHPRGTESGPLGHRRRQLADQEAVQGSDRLRAAEATKEHAPGRRRGSDQGPVGAEQAPCGPADGNLRRVIQSHRHLAPGAGAQRLGESEGHAPVSSSGAHRPDLHIGSTGFVQAQAGSLADVWPLAAMVESSHRSPRKEPPHRAEISRWSKHRGLMSSAPRGATGDRSRRRRPSGGGGGDHRWPRSAPIPVAGD